MLEASRRVTSWGLGATMTTYRGKGSIIGSMPIASPLNAPPAKRPPKVIKIRDGIEVAAKYFVYKLYDTTGGHQMQWHVLHGIGELAATISRAVERGWVIPKGASR